MNDDLWESNASAYVSGDRNNYVTFISGTFASNKNIKDAQIAAYQVLTELRFTRAYYKWYEWDRGVYYTLKAIKDSELIVLK